MKKKKTMKVMIELHALNGSMELEKRNLPPQSPKESIITRIPGENVHRNRAVAAITAPTSETSRTPNMDRRILVKGPENCNIF